MPSARSNASGVWQRQTPDPGAYQQKVMAPHERGAILVAAVFDAFLAITRTDRGICCALHRWHRRASVRQHNPDPVAAT